MRRQQTVKKYFNKSAKAVRFKVNEKVLLWDSSHANRGRHSKFQNLWLGPFKIAFVLGVVEERYEMILLKHFWIFLG